MKKSLTKYNTDGSCGAVDNLIELDENDDVASSLLGGSWRMPTDSNWQELIENSRNRVYTVVNTEMLNLYWNIGKIIIEKHEADLSSLNKLVTLR